MAVAAHYLEIVDQDGFPVNGESEGHDHVEQIDVTGWDWDVSDQSASMIGVSKDPASAGKAAAGSTKASAGGGEVGITPSLLTFTKGVDRATTRLMQAMYRGDELKKATFTLLEETVGVRNERRGAFRLHVVLEKVFVVGYRLGGRSTDYRVDLDETWELHYTTIAFHYETAGMDAVFSRPPGSTKRGASKSEPDVAQLQKQVLDLQQAAGAKAKRG